MDITETLNHWYEYNKRDLPWRNTTNPYKIWLSEIILQQTRVNQGLEYYHDFITKYPNIKTLADAPLDDIMKTWQGLGYYTRARNLHETAKYIKNKLNGHFPDNYKDLLKLKGVGEYTAAAIASFAYDEAVAVVDGNVQRFLSRIYGINTPVNSIKGKKEFREVAENILNIKDPGTHNQAMIEFGALRCTPKNPGCRECPFNEICYAYNNMLTDNLPVKTKSGPKKERFFNYLVIHYNNIIYLEKRNNDDIWKNLYQFPLIETDRDNAAISLTETIEWKKIFNGLNPNIIDISRNYTHILSHQKIKARFISVTIKSTSKSLRNHFEAVSKTEIEKYAIPRLIERFLEGKKLE